MRTCNVYSQIDGCPHYALTYRHLGHLKYMYIVDALRCSWIVLLREGLTIARPVASSFSRDCESVEYLNGPAVLRERDRACASCR